MASNTDQHAQERARWCCKPCQPRQLSSTSSKQTNSSTTENAGLFSKVLEGLLINHTAEHIPQPHCSSICDGTCSRTSVTKDLVNKKSFPKHDSLQDFAGLTLQKRETSKISRRGASTFRWSSCQSLWNFASYPSIADSRVVFGRTAREAWTIGSILCVRTVLGVECKTCYFCRSLSSLHSAAVCRWG